MVIVAFLLAILAAKVLLKEEPAALPGQVWSPEHGHYHDANPAEGGATPGAPPPSNQQPQTGQNVPQPDGPVPPGKVWSPEHGHWHDLE